MARPRSYPLPALGDKFGKYTVIEQPTNAHKILCRCDCGVVRHISAYHLRNRPNISCGCDVGERISICKRTHGNARRGQHTKEYIAWTAMMRRCYNPKVNRYPNYGGRGIKVCDRWHTFANFLADMGTCPEDHTLGRIDNDNDYEPTNCRWETEEQQMNNRSNNVFLEYGGERMTIAQWSRRTGIPVWHISRQKRRGWSDVDILEGRAIGPKQN